MGPLVGAGCCNFEFAVGGYRPLCIYFGDLPSTRKLPSSTFKMPQPSFQIISKNTYLKSYRGTLIYIYIYIYNIIYVLRIAAFFGPCMLSPGQMTIPP